VRRFQEQDMTDSTAIECRNARELMPAAVDGELTGRERAGFETHVERCQACAAELARSRRLADLLGALPNEVGIPDGFEQAVLSKARAALHGGARRPRLGGWVGWSMSGIAAAAALLLAVGLWQRSTAPAPQPSAAARPTVPREVIAAPQRFLDLPVIERLEMLQYLQHHETLDAAVERG